ncbi:hypothetical protein ANACOL_01025 [Anaerotruncus colihominis DSM 17241]|uniref:Uncharacterized protein n=1 Tax=Anaerotruncus colihominis DSM 17241 TaxID=445972 RepID=B0P8D6_9FIRM|nr:hypothetical protein ANACOL_01025 [Anaerotruncus colihominis DSM 17241]
MCNIYEERLTVFFDRSGAKSAPAARRLSRILLAAGPALAHAIRERLAHSRGRAPKRASQGAGRPPLMLSPPLFGAIVSGARRCVLW